MRPVFRFHTGVFQAERRGVRHAAQREQDFLGGNGNRFAVLLERNRFQFSFALRVQKFRAGENLDAFAPENLFDFHSGIGIELLQNVFAALDERDLDAEAREELRELAAIAPPPRMMSDFGSFFSATASSLVMKPTLVKLRQWRWRDAGAGGDDEIFRGELLAVAPEGRRSCAHPEILRWRG
jgi:hypothetical protein